MLIIEHDGRVVLLRIDTRDDLVGLLGHLLVDILTLLIILIDMTGLAHGSIKVFLYQQIDTFLSVLHTSGGIDTRTNLKDDITHGDLTPAQSTDVDNGFQAYRRVLVELFQAVEREDTVLIHHRHKVGSDTHRTEVEQRDEPRERDAVVL